ncbi:hypothetical protein ACTD5D_21625 [Nocardia takedensis]|uniref:hypothetical protein n=1 Tax=Nocardia takedensis TaxID=259390 RepID=UPI003F75E037
MPKNSSARRRRRTRRVVEATGLQFTAAQRLGDAKAAAHGDDLDSVLRPHKVDDGGVWRYIRRRDALISQDGLGDPSAAEVIAAADAVLPLVRALMTARLRPVTTRGRDGQPRRIVQCTDFEYFRSTVGKALVDLARVREDAEIAYVEWNTVACAYYGIRVELSGLARITDGPLRDRLDSAVTAAEVLADTCEAVHSRGCLLGAGENRHRRLCGYTPCGGGDIRFRLRVYDEETTVTDPGCPRHIAEEIITHDFAVEDGDTALEVLGGADADLDRLYDLADLLRRRREQLWRAQEQDRTIVAEHLSPPWMRPEARR